MSAITFRTAVADLFKAHPGEWLSAYRLMSVGGGDGLENAYVGVPQTIGHADRLPGL